MYSNFNPLVIIMSLSVYMIMLNTRSPFVLSDRACFLVHQVASLGIGIYVIHPLWIAAGKKIGMSGLWLTPVLGIPALSIIVFMLSWATASALGRVPLLKYSVT